MVTECGTGYGKNGDKGLETEGTGKSWVEKTCGGGQDSQMAVEPAEKEKGDLLFQPSLRWTP